MTRYCQACGDEREVPMEVTFTHKVKTERHTYILCGTCLLLAFKRLVGESIDYQQNALITYMDGLVRR